MQFEMVARLLRMLSPFDVFADSTAARGTSSTNTRAIIAALAQSSRKRGPK